MNNSGNVEKNLRKVSINIVSPSMTFLFCLFLCIKMFTERGADLSWWFVTGPLWFPWAACVAFFFGIYLFAGICFVIGYALIGIVYVIQWIVKKVKRIFKKN